MPASPPQYHLCCQSLDRCSYVGRPRGRASGTLPPAARRVRPLDQSIPPDPQPIGDPEADPAPASDLVVELEGAVEPREACEPADLELEAVLGLEGGGPAQQQYRHDRDYPHGTTPRWSKSDPQNREFVRKTR